MVGLTIMKSLTTNCCQLDYYSRLAISAVRTYAAGVSCALPNNVTQIVLGSFSRDKRQEEEKESFLRAKGGKETKGTDKM